MLPYPKTHTISQTDTYFGTEVSDPYRWLEDIDSPETQAWVEAENKVTASYLEALPTRPALQKRLEELVNFERFSAPEKHGSRYFYSHNTGLQNQSPVYWTEGLQGEPHLLIDPNTLASDGTVALGGLNITHDGRLAATALAEAGSDWQTIRVREVESGRELDDVIHWTKFGGAAWLRDNSGFFYSGYDAPPDGDALKATNYFQKIFLHKLGTPQSEDAVVFERADEKEIFLGAGVTDDGRYLILWQGQGTSPKNELAFLDLAQEGAKPVRLTEGPDAAYNAIGNDGSRFWIYTTLDAPNGKVIEVDLAAPERTNWKTVLPESTAKLESVSLVNRQLLANYLTDAHSEVRRFTEDGESLGTLALPAPGTVNGLSGERDDTETFYTFTNFTTPGAIYRLDLTTGVSTIFREPRLTFSPSEFETKLVFAESKDGTRVPLFLSYKKGLKLDGKNPTLLYAYGGFGISLTPAYSSSRILWMQMGGVYAQACLRGGGEYGEAWHQAGMKLQKQNVFDDFIACAEWLIANRYTSSAKLAIQGGSNGGLLVGAMLTQRPELFAAALPAVGVMDMLRFDRFTIGWGWKQEYGSPSENEEEFRAIYRYSPLHTLKAGVKYPATMITTGDHDDRVFPAHSFKFAAAMQACQGGGAPALIRIETRAGHGAGMPIAKQLAQSADIYAFLIEELKIEPQL
jgi:prolyl oligopeptidase